MIELETITKEDIKNILLSKNISIVLEQNENDDEIEIQHEDENVYSIYVKVDVSHNSLRIYGITDKIIRERKNKLDGNELLEVINMINLGSNVVKYSTISGLTVTFEYGIPLIGKISEDHLIHTINFVMNEVSLLGEIFDHFLKLARKINK
ncbi:TPA: hypothetical protein RFN21_003933 [Klebsiella aerogenes]|nr:hypothetical protein [Klebsiella aerogenes]